MVLGFSLKPSYGDGVRKLAKTNMAGRPTNTSNTVLHINKKVHDHVTLG